MKATIKYVEQRVAEFNRRMFANRLPPIPIELGDAAGYLGLFLSDRQKTSFKLRINTRIDMPQDALDDVIIHEMIHYFIAWSGLVDSSPHGNIFRSIMLSINASHGRNIQISGRNSSPQEQEQAVSKRPTWHVIAELEIADGTWGVKVLPRVRQKVAAYAAAVRQAPNIRSVKLYLHNNPFFNRYPTSAALKYHSIDRDTFLQNLAGAQPLNDL